jgi:hypothetical protein
MLYQSCDTMVALGTATRNGQTIFAKNSDRPVVRERWKAFQNQLLETVYHMAYQGRRLLDDGRTAEASHLLTTYMTDNVSTMLSLVSEMLKELQKRRAPVAYPTSV